MGIPRLIHMGNGYRPHGIRGGLTLSLFNREDSHLRPGQRVFLKPLGSSRPGGEREFVIADIRFGNKVICYLVGICRREQAEEILPFSLYMERSDFRPLEEQEGPYLADLPGLRVLNSGGEEVGAVLGTYHNGAHGVLEVRWGEETVDIPLVPSFVLGCDVSEGWIKLVFPELIS